MKVASVITLDGTEGNGTARNSSNNLIAPREGDRGRQIDKGEGTYNCCVIENLVLLGKVFVQFQDRGYIAAPVQTVTTKGESIRFKCQ